MEESAAKVEPEANSPSTSKSWRFYLILLSLNFISSLDGSIIATALPRITSELSAADSYVWIANSFLIAQTVIQPLCAQLSNIFGRRNPMIISIAIFALGSGIAGGANASTMMIAGRTVQGLGAGAIFMLVEIIVCDLVPLRERGKYLGFVLSSSAIGAIMGPVVGGVLADANWRWIFYLNIPTSGLTIAIMLVFLRLHHKKETTWAAAFLRIDWVGSLIFIASICSLLIGLVFGGSVFPWSSWRVIVPIILGVMGWAGFHVYEWKPPHYCKEVMVPPRLFSNRTSVAGFYINFVSSILLQWVCFFWPFYFQALKGVSPLRAGINFVPYEAFLIITAAGAGGILSKFGYYRPMHFLGFCLGIIGSGLNIMLSPATPKAVWVIFQIVDAVGRALLLPTVLPAIMTSMPESDVASATGIYSFLRSFGFVWGITIPGIIFNAQFDRHSSKISKSSVREQLQGGRAYQFVGGSYIRSLEPTVRQEVISVYQEALKAVWIGAVAFGVAGIAAVFVEKHITLRTELDTQFGIEQGGNMKKKHIPQTGEKAN